MEFLINDPEVPRLPALKTRLLDLWAEPSPDGQRLKVGLRLTPFEKRPTVELSLLDSSGELTSSASIIEPVGWELELTLHVRKKEPAGVYRLNASLLYPELGEVDRREIEITVPAPTH